MLDRWNRFEVLGVTSLPDDPGLIDRNNGSRTRTDLDALARVASLRRLPEPRATAARVQRMAWNFGLGPLVDPFDCRPADEAAVAGLFSHLSRPVKHRTLAFLRSALIPIRDACAVALQVEERVQTEMDQLVTEK